MSEGQIRSVPRLARNTLPRRGHVEVVAGSGARFADRGGREYIDLSSQTVNLLFGQSHPRFIADIDEQLRRYTFVDQDFGCPADMAAIERLAALLPNSLVAYNIRMCNGSDAVESAVKQARRATGRSRVLTFDDIYLGQTTQMIHFRGLGDSARDILVGSTEDIVFAPRPFCFEHDHDAAACAIENGDLVCEMIRAHRNSLACVILDPIMISSGVFGGRRMAEVASRVREECTRHGVALIVDESQTFGWVPDHTLSAHWGIEPDLLVLSKGVAGGFPLSVCAASDAFDNLEWGEADYTNGGHAICVAALNTTCQLLVEQSEVDHFDTLVDTFDRVLAEIPAPLGHRGIGLIRAIDVRAAPGLSAVDTARAISDKCLERGVYVRPYGPTLGIKPPRSISPDELESGIRIVADTASAIAEDLGSTEPAAAAPYGEWN